VKSEVNFNRTIKSVLLWTCSELENWFVIFRDTTGFIGISADRYYWCQRKYKQMTDKACEVGWLLPQSLLVVRNGEFAFLLTAQLGCRCFYCKLS